MSSLWNTIFGGPGTGKTTRLLEIIDELIAQGVDTRRIAFVSYTNPAVDEMKERIAQKYSYLSLKNDFPYFQTLHSVATRELAINTKEEILTDADLQDFGKENNYRFTELEDDVWSKLDDNEYSDNILFNLFMLQLRLQVSDEKLLEEQHPIIRLGYSKFKKLFVDYLERENLYTWEWMLEKLYQEKVYPFVDYVFVDEVQDCNALQWKVIDDWLKRRGIIKITIAGDDDQAIFGWAGAKAIQFLDHSRLGGKEMIEETKRLPPPILSLYEKIVSRIETRQEKRLFTKKMGGAIYRTDAFHIPALLKNAIGESWYILARNRFALKSFYTDVLKPSGIPYLEKHKDGIRFSLSSKAAVMYYRIKKGEDVYKMQDIYDLIPATNYFEYGGKTKLFNAIKKQKKELKDKGTEGEPAVTITELIQSYGMMERTADLFKLCNPSFLKIEDEMLEYYEKVWNTWGSAMFEKQPNILLSTIHGVKGGEADNVILLTDLSKRAYRSFENKGEVRDEALRVVGEAISRTKKNLYICKPFCSSKCLLDFFPEFDKFGYV